MFNHFLVTVHPLSNTHTYMHFRFERFLDLLAAVVGGAYRRVPHGQDGVADGERLVATAIERVVGGRDEHLKRFFREFSAEDLSPSKMDKYAFTHTRALEVLRF